MPAMVETRDLTRTFGPLTAVDNLSLEVAPGEIFGLVGPDGAGKTTTLRLLCGLMDPDRGTVRVDGLDVRGEPDRVKDRIGYMAQRFGLYVDLTVQENMLFYADLFGIGRAERDDRMPRLLHMTRMEPFRDRPAGKLSGGMKQKLALMCTLLHHPRVLFLDEPTNGVDPVSRRDFWAILYHLVNDGMTVVITTAYLDEAERCNRVGLMYRGRLIRCDSPERLRSGLEEPCFDVVTPDRRAAKAFLDKAAGVLSVEPAGPSLHLFLVPGDTTADRLREALDGNGLGPASLIPMQPSLEDVFIALVRKAGADAQGGVGEER